MARRPGVTAATAGMASIGMVALTVACGPIGRSADEAALSPSSTTSTTPTGTSTSTSTATTSTATSGTGTSSPSPSTPSVTTTRTRPTRVAWVPFGPASPGSPPPFGWYGALEDRDCEGLRTRAEGDSIGDQGPDQVRPIYLALAYACSAAVEGDQADWTLAVSAADGVDRSVDYGCLDGAALGLLDRLVEAHTAAPDLPVRLREGRGTACPFEVTAVKLLGSDGVAVDGPASGPVAGGTTVQVSGKGFVDVTAVRFGDVAAGAPELSPGADSLVVTAPPAAEPGPVRVVVESPAGMAASEPGAFTYTDDATDSGG
ncbi:MAG TPA: IPT/TIG domain-containing protein [Actinomycetes bacterium]